MHNTLPEMNPVVQEDRTGCGIACVAMVTNRRYSVVKRAAERLGIFVGDSKLWSDPQPVRTLLAHFGVSAERKERAFASWDRLPARALLAIKWQRGKTGPAWHWVVFVREPGGGCVLDPKRALRTNRRTDFGRMKPKWSIRIGGAED